jgi:hypothetical protein
MTCLATFSMAFLTTGARKLIIPLYADNIISLGRVEIGTVISYITILNLIMTMLVARASPTILGFIADNFGLRVPFYFMTALLFINAMVVFFIVQETFAKKKILS